MPRLTNASYLDLHDELQDLWINDRQQFAKLSSRDQWALHAFFFPDEDASDEILLNFRTAITKEQPSLPQKAGRALRQLRLIRPGKAPPAGSVVPSGDRFNTQVRTRALVHPEIKSGPALAPAFWSIAVLSGRAAIYEASIR